jgi:(p)ppGpp synthase/HD superfamily hydrolase
MATLDDAILLAVQAHRGQLDRYGAPYILHPLRVLQRMESEHERMAAVLHDVVEDTPYTLDDLRQMGYPEDVLQAVDRLTRRDDETYEQYVERAAADPLARRVKLADLEDNMDLRRLDNVADKDRERLERYLNAWRYLKGLETA